MRLSIGSGTYGEAGWVTLDADPASGAQIIATVPPLPSAVTSVEWDQIQMIHSLEHLYRWDAADLMAGIHQVLKPGGMFIVELPNLAFACAVLTGQKPPIPGTIEGQSDMWPIFGNPNERNPLYGHRWGYTPASLKAALIEAGFDAARISEQPARHHVPLRDFRMEAVK